MLIYLDFPLHDTWNKTLLLFHQCIKFTFFFHHAFMDYIISSKPPSDSLSNLCATTIFVIPSNFNIWFMMLSVVVRSSAAVASSTKNTDTFSKGFSLSRSAVSPLLINSPSPHRYPLPFLP